MENLEKKIWDVNVLAIYLVKDHPGNRYITEVVDEGLRGGYIPVIIDILPIRVYWVMERLWEINRGLAAESIMDFLEKYEIVEIVSLEKDTILDAFRLADDLNHDVYDCVYLALARQVKAKSIVTTDTDFEKLCKSIGIEYINPVPKNILKRFKSYK